MALVPIQTLRTQVMRVLRRTEPPAGIELLSYKRDRGIAVFPDGKGRFRVVEKGFAVQELVVGDDELGRVLKTMFKREFPRSRKVRLVRLASPADLARKKVRI